MTTSALSDLPYVTRARFHRDVTSWFQETLRHRLGRKQLASLSRIADAYAERCEKFAVEQELGPMRDELANAKGALDTYLENKCPKCKEFVHPRAKRCGTCQANAEREIYTKELLAMSDILSKAHNQRDTLRRHVDLAMKALAHGRHEKKKGKFLRQALAILEAATTEDHPRLSKAFGGIGTIGLLSALALPLMGWVSLLKKDGKTPNGTPEPPTPEAAARAIP